MHTYDVVIVGSGPNGLAAAITLARAGASVLVLEAQAELGGGMRTVEATEPGFLHDHCSAIHPLGVGSPFFRALPLAEHGLEWVHAPLPLAHPLDDGSAAVLYRSVDQTAHGLGTRDRDAYRKLMRPYVERWDDLGPAILGPPPLLPPMDLLGLLARFGLQGLRSAVGLARASFRGRHGRALFAGMAAHSMLRLDQLASASFGLVLAMLGHVCGWPMARGGSRSIAAAMVSYLRSLGGECRVDHRVRSLEDVPACRVIMFDLTPRQVLSITGRSLPSLLRARLGRFRYGSGVFKIDYSLDGPIPWKAEPCHRASTVHLGGTIEEIADAERLVRSGSLPERPYVIVAQQSAFDDSRAPSGKQTGWAYCHVPHGSPVDATSTIEGQIERFAPGFKDLVRTRRVTSPADFERYDENFIGGDINGGIQDLGQLFARPIASRDPYRLSSRYFLCSSSTPPGGGVHGMCGYWAARSVLRSSQLLRTSGRAVRPVSSP